MDEIDGKGPGKPYVPVYLRILLTLEEAAAYAGIGVNKMREISHDPDFEAQVICTVGARRMFVRRAMDDFFYGNPGFVV